MLNKLAKLYGDRTTFDHNGKLPGFGKNAFFLINLKIIHLWRFSTAWYGTVRYGTVHFWGVFHWVLYLVPDTFLVPLRSRFHRAVPLPKRDV